MCCMEHPTPCKASLAFSIIPNLSSSVNTIVVSQAIVFRYLEIEQTMITRQLLPVSYIQGGNVLV